MDHPAETSAALKRGVFLEAITALWCLACAVAALALGIAADSIALSGFGLEAVLGAVVSGLIVWQLLHPFRGQSRMHDYARHQRRALFVTGGSFFLLPLLLLSESGSRLFYKERPDASIAGLVLSALSLAVAGALAVMKFRTAKALGSAPARSGALMTAYGIPLSLVLFAGLLLRISRAWWWADPAAALLMIPFIVRKGWETVEKSKGDV